MISTKALRDIALAATLGKYEYYPQSDGDGWLGHPGYHGDLFFANPKDAEFIAAASPSTIIALLDVVEASRAIVREGFEYDDYFGIFPAEFEALKKALATLEAP